MERPLRFWQLRQARPPRKHPRSPRLPKKRSSPHTVLPLTATMAEMSDFEVRILSSRDFELLTKAAPGVFDDPVVLESANRFLDDPRHHLAVAIVNETVVGFISAVHYDHPDKARPELWINE